MFGALTSRFSGKCLLLVCESENLLLCSMFVLQYQILFKFNAFIFLFGGGGLGRAASGVTLSYQVGEGYWG